MPTQKFPVLDSIWIATALLSIEKCRNNPDAVKEDLFFEPMDILNTADKFLDGKIDLYSINCLATAGQEHCVRNYLQADSEIWPSYRRLSKRDECLRKCFPRYIHSEKYAAVLLQINDHQYSIADLFQFVNNEYPGYLEREAILQDDDGFLPKESDYHPGITKEQWIEFLKDPRIVNARDYELLKQYYTIGAPATISEVAEKFHGYAPSYNHLARGIGQKIHRIAKCPVFNDKDYYAIPFFRKIEGSKNIKKMRPELREAIKEIERQKQEEEYIKHKKSNFERNILLYGPSKSGKKLLAMRYAVAICKNQSIPDVTKLSDQKVMYAYRLLIDYKQIVEVCGKDDIENLKLMFDQEDENEFVSKFNAYFQFKNVDLKNVSALKVILIDNLSELKEIEKIERFSTKLNEMMMTYKCRIIATLDSERFHDAENNLVLTSIFHFVEVKPNADVLRKNGADIFYDLDVALMLEKINQRIEFLTDWKLMIGHEHFLEIAEHQGLRTLQYIFEAKVFPQICINLNHDYQKIQLIFGDNAKKNALNKFIIDETVSALDIFKGNFSQFIETEKKKFTINRDAFELFESYLEII